MSVTRQILLINGPNLNLLGSREPLIYGSSTLAQIEEQAAAQAKKHGANLLAFQSNSEANLIDRIHLAKEQNIQIIIINAGAYTHTSIAIRDALTGVGIPFVEVHLSNVHAREHFRHHSYLSDKAEAVIVGMGTYGYIAAIDYVLQCPL